MHPYDNPLKIPKIEKSVSLWTHPDGLVIGSIYLHMGDAERPRAEDPWVVMNDQDDFLVVRRHEPEELRFYNKASLIRVEYTEEELYVAESGKDLPCRVHMMDGSVIEGLYATGISTASVSRMASGGYILDVHRKEWEFGVLFVRLFRSLDAILGHDEQARLWLTHDNLALGGKPLELIRTTEGLVRVVHYLDATRGRI